jgi:hypothetical protein
MRTSDLHAWDWSHIDRNAFVTAQVYRPKTDDRDDAPAELVELVIPEELRSALIAWWTREGRVDEGPVFPVMTGERAGERQTKRSHARELRRAFWRAGAHLPLPGFDDAIARVRDAERRLTQLSSTGEGREAYREALKQWRAATEAAESFPNDPKNWRPHRDSNPGYRRERPMS